MSLGFFGAGRAVVDCVTGREPSDCSRRNCLEGFVLALRRSEAGPGFATGGLAISCEEDRFALIVGFFAVPYEIWGGIVRQEGRSNTGILEEPRALSYSTKRSACGPQTTLGNRKTDK